MIIETTSYFQTVFLLCLLLFFIFILANYYLVRFTSSSKEGFSTTFPNDFDLEKLVDSVGFYDLYNKPSVYQNIQVIQIRPNDYGYDKCLLLNDEIQLCSNDERMYHDFLVHFPISYLKTVKRVLIIGGGDLMTLREVMKYDVKRVDMLELDKQVMKVSLKYFKENDVSMYLDDDRVNIKIGNAVNTIQSLPNHFYDIILIDSTEDSTNNRPIESLSFFQTCKDKLKKNGILVKNGYVVESMPNTLVKKKESILSRLKTLFAKVGIYKVDIPSYDDTKDYKFIMCSDRYHIGDDPTQNAETQKISNSLEEYNVDEHMKYIFKS
jgi:spermidine synthase